MASTDKSDLLSEVEFNRTVSALSREYDGIFSDETVARFVQESLDRWPTPKVALAHRGARLPVHA